MLSAVLQFLVKILYPNGRAFRMPEPVDAVADKGGILFRLHRALNIRMATAFQDGGNVLDVIMPDNGNFTQDDANDWYRRLGLFNSGTVPLNDMKLAIAQKQSHAAVPLGRQNFLFIQAQLQAAGFAVHVWENRFSDGMGGFVAKPPAEVMGLPVGLAVYGEVAYGETQYGGVWADEGLSICANYIEEAKDAEFSFGEDYKCSFFISDDPLPDVGNVLLSRRDEFRQLLLTLKRADSVGVLIVTYV